MRSIDFYLPYCTSSPQQRLEWRGEWHSELPDGKVLSLTLPLLPHLTSDNWHLHLDLPHTHGGKLLYSYALTEGESTLHHEPPYPHALQLPASDLSLSVHDCWITSATEHLFFRPPFNTEDVAIPLDPVAQGESLLLFHLPQLYLGQLALTGAGTALGEWSPTRAIKASRYGCKYVVTLPAGQHECKWVLRHPVRGDLWQEGDNLHLDLSAGEVVTLPPPCFSGDVFQPHPIHFYGTVLPIFSLRTEYSMGIGDFSDARQMVDWLAATGQRVYQLLPINDTTFTHTAHDSYPYNSISTYALHPLYLDVRQLPHYATAPNKEEWEREGARLNALPSIDHSGVIHLKEEIIGHCFGQWYRVQGYDNKEITDYVEEEGEELLSYALFCLLRDRYPGKAVAHYPSYSSVLQEWHEKRNVLGLPAHREVYRHIFTQYYLLQQVLALRSHADHLGIWLKGDLPIGVGRNSVDVWREPTLFCTDQKAGAPPDAFSETGQDWGFPTYHWERMRHDGYRWWRRRFGHMSRYFKAIRIDHILGFFRIWSIPLEQGNPCLGRFVPAWGYSEHELQSRGIAMPAAEPLLLLDEKGLWHPRIHLDRASHYASLPKVEQQNLTDLHNDYYYNRNEALWRETAIQRLQALVTASPLLLCAEDLGMLPGSVGEVLRSLEILSLEIPRMPKKSGSPLLLPHDIPVLSVLSTSTHDMETLREWWSDLSIEEQDHISTTYRLSSPVDEAALVRALAHTSSLFTLLPLQDWCVLSGYGNEVPPMQERINHPEDPHHVWSYRMHGLLSSLAADSLLRHEISQLTHP